MFALFADQMKTSFHQSATEGILPALASIHELADPYGLTILHVLLYHKLLKY